MVTSAPTSTDNYYYYGNNESGTPLSNSGSASALCYYSVGPAQEVRRLWFWNRKLVRNSFRSSNYNLGVNIAADAAVTVLLLTRLNSFSYFRRN
jgi:hypothetical protein